MSLLPALLELIALTCVSSSGKEKLLRAGWMHKTCLERLPLKFPGNSVVLIMSLPWKTTAATYEDELRLFVVTDDGIVSNLW